MTREEFKVRAGVSSPVRAAECRPQEGGSWSRMLRELRVFCGAVRVMGEHRDGKVGKGLLGLRRRTTIIIMTEFHRITEDTDSVMTSCC